MSFQLHRGLIADLHTHSEYSHDSVCKIETMFEAQVKKGTRIFAVTDHFDTASSGDYNLFTPILTAGKAIRELNQKYGDQCLILSGIEISEGFWYPQIYKRAIGMMGYDVVLGSVHLVQYPGLTFAYSKIDFSELTNDTIIQYVDSYFDDLLTMIDSIDFDVLAHLTCPFRYINGKYKIGLELSLFQKKIHTILQRILQKGLALEVNTSYYDTTEGFMPTTAILQDYYNMGGYLVTLGSDAHIPQNASIHFREAIGILKEIGFQNIYYYRKRKPYKITI